MLEFKDSKIAIIGLGYVGLPLAFAFSEKYPVIGYDINSNRISELNNGIDSTNEIKDFSQMGNLQFTDELEKIINCNIFIVTVPTPVDQYKQPDLSLIKSASEMIGKIISKGSFVIFESTVFPGATEEICLPIIEDISGLKLNEDFFAGYSPERINPGDETRGVKDIKKVTSGSSKDAASFIDNLYSSIITAGTFMASSIKVAEAAKVIENTQRDLNIALMNELSIIFDRLRIDTNDVLEAASTKWNFLKFQPGLVGGHCIGVDPYYLTHKAQAVGYNPEIILAGRRLNDEMPSLAALRLVKLMIKKELQIVGARILILGITFKENCPDTRNSKVLDLVLELQSYGAFVDVLDPICNAESIQSNPNINLIGSAEKNTYDAIILAVPHKVFLNDGIDWINSLLKQVSIFFDLKSIFPKDSSNLRL